MTVPQTRPTTGKASNGLPRRTGGGTRMGTGEGRYPPLCRERAPGPSVGAVHRFPRTDRAGEVSESPARQDLAFL